MNLNLLGNQDWYITSFLAESQELRVLECGPLSDGTILDGTAWAPAFMEDP